MKNHLKAYLTFSKKERTGIIVLLVLIFLTTLAIFFAPLSMVEEDPAALAQFREQQALLREAIEPSGGDGITGETKGNGVKVSGRYGDEDSIAGGVLFAFDPNTLSAAGWRKLGLRERTIQTIVHYVSRGGKFRSPDDLYKIYGMRARECERLMPYVEIAEPGYPERGGGDNRRPYQRADSVVRGNYGKSYGGRTYKAPASVNINEGDSASFEALPGIGPVLAARIVRFREKLGGFYSLEQVGETYGLPDSTYSLIRDYLRFQEQPLRMLNINAGVVDSLRHPYLTWQMSRAIVQYRQQHGSYTSVDQLLQINIMTPEILAKLRPYLSMGEGR